jgi:hypothetical protein
MSRRGLATVLAAALAAAALTPAAAQEPAPLFVDFDFGAYPSALLPDAAAARQEVVAGIAEAAAGKLPWRFAPATGAADFPRLAVAVVRRQSGDLELEAALILDAQTADGRWAGGFVSEGEREELGGFPAPTTIPARVVEHFAERVLTAERVTPTGGDLFARLRERVPLGRSAHLPAGEDRGAVGLEFAKLYRYSLSTFRMDCRNRDGEVVSLYSKGTGATVPYPASPPFDAIRVEHARWREGTDDQPVGPDHLARLGELRLQRVFLEEFDPRGLTLDPAGGSVSPIVAGGGGP